MKKTDMSAKAVAARLKRVAQLRRLCISLGKSKPASGSSRDVGGRAEK